MRSLIVILVLGMFFSLCSPRAGAEKIVLVAGGGNGEGQIAALQARLIEPFGIAFDPLGNLYIVEHSGHRIRKVNREGILTTIAGTGQPGSDGDGGPARKARFDHPHGLAIAGNGDIYVADTLNCSVRKIDAETGVISTVAGTGKKGFSGDGGPASQAEFGNVYSVAFDSTGESLYVADLDNRRIRVIHLKTGIVDTVAGNGARGVPTDGAEARSSPLIDPRAVDVDRDGNVYILERGGHALRAVDIKGRIRTVVGTGEAGGEGDGGDATKATLRGPKHLCIDLEGNVVIADTNNHIIRRYLPREAKIVRVAGSGAKGAAGVGRSPAAVQLYYPHGVYQHPSGALYIADSNNHRILKIEE